VVSQHVAASRRARLVCDSPTAALPSIFLAGMGRLVCPHASQRERADAEPRVLAGARGARVLQPPAQPGHRVGDPTMALSGAAGGASVDGQLCVRAGVPHVVPLAHGPAQGAHTRFGFTGFGASSRAFHLLRFHPAARAPPAPPPTPPPSKSSTRPITSASTQQELHPPHHLRLHPARAPPAPSPTPPPSKSSRSNRRARAPPTATPQRASRVSQTNEEKGRGLIRYGACGVVGCTRDRGRTRWRWRCPRRCARCSSASRRW
jgi:hypothetical protein